jgi:hypothetical protein
VTLADRGSSASRGDRARGSRRRRRCRRHRVRPRAGQGRQGGRDVATRVLIQRRRDGIGTTDGGTGEHARRRVLARGTWCGTPVGRWPHALHPGGRMIRRGSRGRGRRPSRDGRRRRDGRCARRRAAGHD